MDAKQLIEEIEKKEKITRYRIALDMGVKPSTVYQWESGKKRPNGEHLMELLRRAGRLAAMVLIVSGVSGVSVPQEARAEGPTLLNQIEKRLCIMSNYGSSRKPAVVS